MNRKGFGRKRSCKVMQPPFPVSENTKRTTSQESGARDSNQSLSGHKADISY